MIGRQIKLYSSTVNGQVQNLSVQFDETVSLPKYIINNYSQIVDWVRQALSQRIDVTCYYVGRTDNFEMQSYVALQRVSGLGASDKHLYTVLVDNQAVAIGVDEMHAIGHLLRRLEKLNKCILGVENHKCDEKLLKLYTV